MSRKIEKLLRQAAMQRIIRQFERGNYDDAMKVTDALVTDIRWKDGRYEIDTEVEIDGHTSVRTVRAEDYDRDKIYVGAKIMLLDDVYVLEVEGEKDE